MLCRSLKSLRLSASLSFRRSITSISSCQDELTALGVPVIAPDDSEYNSATHIYNPAFANEHPAFVARPTTVQQVQQCLQTATKNTVRVAVKSGGHSFAGYSSIDSSGFVLSLDAMKSMDWIGDRLRVAAGCSWSDVYAKVETKNHIIVGGCCPSVGVGGYVLGGGYGLLSRLYGLGSDNAVAMTMVTENGEKVVEASRTENPDLFWGLCGGGGGNFGVLVDVTFDLHPPKSAFYWTSMEFSNTDESRKALTFIGKYLRDIPRDVNVDMLIQSAGGEKQLLVDVVTSEATNDDVLVSSLLSLSSSKRRLFHSYDSYTKLVSDYSERHGYVHYENEPVYMKGVFVNDIPPSVSSYLVDDVVFPERPLCIIEFVHVGGQIAAKAPNYSAYVHRSAQYNCYSYGRFDNDAEKAVVFSFANAVHDSLRRYGVAKGAYVNYMDKYLHDWAPEYYGTNYERLCDLKQKWNPIDNNGPLHFLQEIGSLYNPPDD